MIRRQTGIELNLEGFDLDHISVDGRVVYRNPFIGARFSEDDIGVAPLLEATGAWARGHGPEPYPLADGLQDHLISLAIGESVGAGGPVTTTTTAHQGRDVHRDRRRRGGSGRSARRHLHRCPHLPECSTDATATPATPSVLRTFRKRHRRMKGSATK